MKKLFLTSISILLLFGLVSNISATTFLPECQDENYLFENSDIVVIGNVDDVNVETEKTYATIMVSYYLKGNNKNKIVVYSPVGIQGEVAGMAKFYKGEKVK